MSLLIIGNLHLSDDHKEYLKQLIGNFTHIKEDCKDIQDIISESHYIFCCNFNLNPYLKYLSNCRLVVMAETGIVNIDVNKARIEKINICNLDSYSCDAVVQYISYCIFKELRPWHNYFSKSYNRELVINNKSVGLETLTVGIIGYGIIGRKLAKIFNAYDCNVIANKRNKFSCSYAKYSTKDNLFENANIIVICCDLNDTSLESINLQLLNKMRKDTILVSISPRQVFNNKDLQNFLHKRKDIIAYLDYDVNDTDYDFNKLDNVNISPHLAFYTQQTIVNRTNNCIERLESYLQQQKKDRSMSIVG